MTTPLSPLYDNTASPELLSRLSQPRPSDMQHANLSEDVAALIRKNEAYAAAHPPIAIYRFATEGSRTRNGGEIQNGSSTMTITIQGGRELRGALKGDYVVYPDGSRAQIISGTGHENGDMALVGSRLSNGDEIISTPQDVGLWVQRAGEQMADDFLPPL